MGVISSKVNVKIASLLNKRNPTNADAQELKKAQRQQSQTKKSIKNTFKAKSIKSETQWMIDNHE